MYARLAALIATGMLQSTPALAETVKVPMVADETNASSCFKGKGSFTLNIDRGQFTVSVLGAIKQSFTVPTGPDGNFDKQIDLIMSDGTVHYRMWGNVQAREIHTHNPRRFCKYSGRW